MSEEYETFPCHLCRTPYKTMEAAEKCFIDHTREEHLVWAVRELYELSFYGYDVLERVDQIMSKYDLDDEWYP